MAAGTRSLLAFWIGGAGSSAAAPPATAGFKSAMAFWLGGAGTGGGLPAPTAGFRSQLAIWLGGAGVSSGVTPFPTQFSGFDVIYARELHHLCLVAEADAPTGMGGVMKVHIDGVTYACYLVEADDDYASNLRLRTGTGVKSIRLKT